MQLRRTVFGTVVVTGLILGLTGCGGNDQATQPTPVSDTPSPTMPVTTPTPVDTVAAAKAKVLADYKNYLAVQARGLVTNDPTFAYDQVMTGDALKLVKSVVTGARLRGTRYTGTTHFLKGSVVALNLKAKPATATVQACVLDALTAKDKKGKTLSAPPQQVSTEDKLVLEGGRWKATVTKTTGKDDAGCAG
jgi:hypothetical protein